MHSILAALESAQNDLRPLAALPPEQLADARNIVFFLVDGFGYHYLRNQTGSFLNKLCSGSIDSVFPSTTASAITTVMSGLSPQTHGIPGWFTYFKEIGGIVATLPFRIRGIGNHLVDKVDPRDLFGNHCMFTQSKRASYVVTPEHLADSAYSRVMCGPAQRIAYRDLDHCFSQLNSLIHHRDKKYVYAYWPEFDSLCHKFGVHSHQVQEHFDLLDRSFENFFSLAAQSDTAMIISADHGFVDTSPSQTIHLRDHPNLAQCLTMPLCGEPRTAYCYVRGKYHTQFEQYIEENFSDRMACCDSASLLEQGYFGCGPIHDRFYDRIGDYTLIMRDHYVITDQLLSEQAFNMIGVHGGLHDHEREIPLIVARL